MTEQAKHMICFLQLIGRVSDWYYIKVRAIERATTL